jgi:hypothetical protein
VSIDSSHPHLLDLPSFASQLDLLGAKSAEAQNLRVPITTYEKLLTENDQILLVYIDSTTKQGNTNNNRRITH